MNEYLSKGPQELQRNLGTGIKVSLIATWNGEHEFGNAKFNTKEAVNTLLAPTATTPAEMNETQDYEMEGGPQPREVGADTILSIISFDEGTKPSYR